MANDMTPLPQKAIAPPMSGAKKLGVGLALVLLPAGAAVTAWILQQGEGRRNADLEKSFNYDIDVKAMRTVDPALVKYKEVGKIETGMDSPRSIAVGADGQIIVAGDRLVRVLQSDGRVSNSFAISGEATAVDASHNGTIYIAMKDRVARFAAGSSSAGATEWATLEKGSHVTSIAVAKDVVYMADAGRRAGRVLKFDLSGKFLGEIAAKDDAKGIPGILTPSPHMDLAITADGNVWVANPGHHQLELYSPDGTLQGSWGKAGTTIDTFLGCCNPSDFALLSDGRIVTAEKGIARVKIYQPDGHFQSVVATPEQFGGNRAGLDLATDARGRVLLLEPGTRGIRVFARVDEGKP